MNISSVDYFFVSERDTAYVANHRVAAHLATAHDIVEAAQKATRLSMYHTLGAKHLWADIVNACRGINIPLQDIVFKEFCFGKTLVERVLEAEDWRSSEIIADGLPDGSYAEGCIIKNKNLFYMLVEQGSGHAVGIKMFDSGALYGGGLKDGKRHGFGVFDSGQSATYSGDWYDDKRHGWGRSEMSFPSRFKQEGRFEGGLLVEPAKPQTMWQSLRRLIR
jgi:hypothetical protein